MKAWNLLRHALPALVFLLPLSASPAIASPLVEVRSSGSQISPINSVYRLPASASNLNFAVGDPPISNNPKARRFRYMLEGYESKWNEPPGEMSLVIRFYDKNNNQVAQTIFPCVGSSSGWKDSPENSTFTHQRESILVPLLADNFRIIISSAGPPSSVGILIVDDITVSEISQNGRPSQKLLEMPDSWPDARKPPGWDRSGSHPAMAKVLTLEKEGLSKEILAVVDDDPLSHAEWQLSAAAAPSVKPGERLLLEWNEMFCIGSANLFTASYHDLTAGRYRFLVNELDVLGAPTPQLTTLEIAIPLPYWKSLWFLLLTSLTATLLTALGVRTLIRFKLRRQIEKLQRERMLEQERLRIARDIHDDLGTRLTHISLLSGMAENNAETEGDRKNFTEISKMARELVFAMYETVWSVNPENDHLESLISFLCQSTENLCKPANIRCRIKVSPISDDPAMGSEIRHNIILAVKETVHNAIKHSRASEISLQVSFTSPKLHIRVSDDGCGFDATRQPSGHGLRNLDRRMEAIGGKACVESQENHGTCVHFIISLP